MVEAAGIEPASEKVRTEASTRLAGSVFYLTADPLNGKWESGQPVCLTPRSRASPGSQPEFASFLPVASGRATGGTSRSI